MDWYRVIIPEIGERTLCVTEIGTDGLHYGVYSPSDHLDPLDDSSIALESVEQVLRQANSEEISNFNTWQSIR